MKKPNNTTKRPLMPFLIAWGIGGCWSGFTHASIVETNTHDEANGVAMKEAIKTRADAGVSFSRGCSAIAEPLESVHKFKDTGLYNSRLKLSAKEMLKGSHQVNPSTREWQGLEDRK